MIRVAMVLGMSLVGTAAWGQTKPIVEIKGVEPERSVFGAAKRGEPLVVKTAEELGKHFSEEAAGKLKQQVDLSKQVLLVFAWRGSGQDKLSFEVLESFPEQIRFQLKPGRTRDLRPHVHLFAVRSNVKWTVK